MQRVSSAAVWLLGASFLLGIGGCGTSLCTERRDPTGSFCVGERLSFDQALERARGRQPELADATLVRASSAAVGTMNVDGEDVSWQLIFVVGDGTDRTLTVSPERTDVRPGGAPESSCEGAADDDLPTSADATQSAVLEFETGRDLVQQGMQHDLVFFYEHECYDATTARTVHVEVAEQTEVRTNHYFYVVNADGQVTSVCGPCDVGDIHACEPCAAP